MVVVSLIHTGVSSKMSKSYNCGRSVVQIHVRGFAVIITRVHAYLGLGNINICPRTVSFSCFSIRTHIWRRVFLQKKNYNNLPTAYCKMLSTCNCLQ